jgi:eukaryotic-like serine/threonine-protein kinase
MPPPADLIDRLRDATLGDYEILAELGRGGMATVFLAHDIQLDRKVAIKLMHPQAVHGEGLVDRFKLEARTAAGLSHPHIIPIYAVKQVGDLVYFVMKFVGGRPLDSILREGTKLPVPMVRTILTKVGEALAYAHKNGVVHRDIKPANIMIDTEGMPVVTDFGIAKVSEGHGLTMTGTTIGTPTYMSPEQCNAEPITGASDQYSLGVMAYEMLVGRPLYEGDSVVTIMFKHVHGPVPTPDDFGPSVPADLAGIVVRMLQKAPADRWPSMAEAVPALRASGNSEEDSARTQMIQYALSGTNRQILERVSTPRSPLPATGRRALPSTEPTHRMAPLEAPRSKVPIVVASGLILAAVAAVAALVLWHPWRSGAAGLAIQPTATPVDSASVRADTNTAPAVPKPAPPTAVADTAPHPPVVSTAEPVRPAPPVAHEVRILDAPATVAEGDTVPLAALVLDRQGRRMNQSVRWSSSAPGVAEIQPDGRLRAVSAGRATLTAEAEGLSATANVTVTAVVAGVVVAPASGQLRPGEVLTLAASPVGRDDRPLAGRVVAWRSSDENVAVVSTTGRVTAVGTGTATISATSEGQVGSARVTVAAPAPAPDTATPPAPVDQRPAITDLVRAYAHALETKDMSRVKALYPGMTTALERRTRDALDAMEDVRVNLTPTQIAVEGTTARARVTGEWTYQGGRRLPVDNVYLFERRAVGWVIVGIN